MTNSIKQCCEKCVMKTGFFSPKIICTNPTCDCHNSTLTFNHSPSGLIGKYTDSTPPKPLEGWVIEFMDFYFERGKYQGRKLGPEQYTGFIRSLLLSQRKEDRRALAEEVGKRRTCNCRFGSTCNLCTHSIDTKNSFIDEAIELILN